MISKELLSEVLGYTPFKIDKIKQVEGVGLTLILLNQDGTVRSYQNIYQLAHKCKEWAFYTYKISVSSFKSGSFYLKEFNQIKDNSEYWVELDTASIDCEINIDDSGIFKSCSEPEAIFKACQWILDNKGNK